MLPTQEFDNTPLEQAARDGALPPPEDASTIPENMPTLDTTSEKTSQPWYSQPIAKVAAGALAIATAFGFGMSVTGGESNDERDETRVEDAEEYEILGQRNNEADIGQGQEGNGMQAENLELNPNTPVKIEYFTELGMILKNVTYANGEVEELWSNEEVDNPDADIFSPEVVIPKPSSDHPQDIIENIYYLRNLAFCVADASAGGNHSEKFLGYVYTDGNTGYKRDLDDIMSYEGNNYCDLTKIEQLNIVKEAPETMTLEYDYLYDEVLVSRLRSTLHYDNDGRWRLGTVSTLEAYK